MPNSTFNNYAQTRDQIQQAIFRQHGIRIQPGESMRMIANYDRNTPEDYDNLYGGMEAANDDDNDNESEDEDNSDNESLASTVPIEIDEFSDSDDEETRPIPKSHKYVNYEADSSTEQGQQQNKRLKRNLDANYEKTTQEHSKNYKRWKKGDKNWHDDDDDEDDDNDGDKKVDGEKKEGSGQKDNNDDDDVNTDDDHDDDEEDSIDSAEEKEYQEQQEMLDVPSKTFNFDPSDVAPNDLTEIITGKNGYMEPLDEDEQNSEESDSSTDTEEELDQGGEKKQKKWELKIAKKQEKEMKKRLDSNNIYHNPLHEQYKKKLGIASQSTDDHTEHNNQDDNDDAVKPPSNEAGEKEDKDSQIAGTGEKDAEDVKHKEE